MSCSQRLTPSASTTSLQTNAGRPPRASMTMNQYAQDARGPCRVLLTGHPWPDLKVERAVFETAGLQLVAGPVEAGSASEIEALVREHDPAAILTCWATVSEVAVAAPTGLKILARLGVG